MGVMDSMNAIIGAVKKVREVAQKTHDAELQDALANLMMCSADLKMEIAELKEENSALRKTADIRAKMSVQDGVLCPAEEIPGYGSGPFCPICFEKDGHLLAIRKNRRTGEWFCLNCKLLH